MPESRTRHKHHSRHPHPVTHHTASKSKRSAGAVLSILAAIIGLSVAFFTQGADVLWLLVGTVAGAVIGYLVGHNMDKTIANDK
jgi:uncharacterized membrane protein YqgA involved in biofilm formation